MLGHNFVHEYKKWPHGKPILPPPKWLHLFIFQGTITRVRFSSIITTQIIIIKKVISIQAALLLLIIITRIIIITSIALCFFKVSQIWLQDLWFIVTYLKPCIFPFREGGTTPLSIVKQKLMTRLNYLCRNEDN